MEGLVFCKCLRLKLLDSVRVYYRPGAFGLFYLLGLISLLSALNFFCQETLAETLNTQSEFTASELEPLITVRHLDSLKRNTWLPSGSLIKDIFSLDAPLSFAAVSAIQIGQVVKIDLPKEGVLETKVVKVQVQNSLLSIHLQAEADTSSQAFFIYNSDTQILSGTLFIAGNSYFVHREGVESYLIEQGERRYEGPNPQVPSVPKIKKGEIGSASLVTTVTADHFVDVMILYTDDVAGFSAVEETLRARVDATNVMLADSCADFRFRLVYIGPITYTETGNTSTDLAQLANASDGQIDSAHTLRDSYGADLVQLVTNTASYCGLAYLSQKDFYNDAYGFSVTSYWCDARTMAHEWGHNLGSEHDRYQKGVGLHEVTTSLTGYGYVDLINKYLDVMAYPDQCDDIGITCTSLGRFSNPRISHNGVPFGIEHYSHSVQRMNESYPYIANFRASLSGYDPGINPGCVSKSENKDFHCFIATAAHGSYLHSEVHRLREFRDRVLRTSAFGRKLIRYYYDFSPFLALKITKHPVLGAATRAFLSLVVFVIHNWISLIAGLLCCLVLVCFYVRTRKKKKDLVGSAEFLCLLFLFSPFFQDDSMAQVSAPSRIYTREIINPSLRMMLKPTSWFGLSYGLQKEETLSQGIYTERTNAEVGSMQLGQVGSDFFYELGLAPEHREITTSSLAGFSEAKANRQIDSYYLQAGLRLYGFPFGLKYRQVNLYQVEEVVRERRQTLSAGISGNWGDSFRWGIGSDLVREFGDVLAKSQWAAPFLGFAVGSFGGDDHFFLEVSGRRSPEVLNRDDAKVNVHGERIFSQISLEYSSKSGFWPFQPLIFRADYSTDTEKKMDSYLIDEIKFSSTEVSLGSSIFSSGLYWTLSYCTRLSDASYTSKRTETRASLFWAGSDVF